ncbi:hypothetical protein, partial [Streptomyces sp. NPDC086766]|uniref:hypothetical protein n=1 Tax=Streptomyces sp. NPDC086766 TaxID=3365754 RepID=UPI00382AF86F
SRPTFHQQDSLCVGQSAGQTASGDTTDILTVSRGCQSFLMPYFAAADASVWAEVRRAPQ